MEVSPDPIPRHKIPQNSVPSCPLSHFWTSLWCLCCSLQRPRFREQESFPAPLGNIISLDTQTKPPASTGWLQYPNAHTCACAPTHRMTHTLSSFNSTQSPSLSEAETPCTPSNAQLLKEAIFCWDINIGMNQIIARGKFEPECLGWGWSVMLGKSWAKEQSTSSIVGWFCMRTAPVPRVTRSTVPRPEENTIQLQVPGDCWLFGDLYRERL